MSNRSLLLVLAESKKKDSAMAASPLWVSEELEYWDSNIRFTHIAATYSELVAISTQGQLHQWRWADAHPYQRTDVSIFICLLSYFAHHLVKFYEKNILTNKYYLVFTTYPFYLPINSVYVKRTYSHLKWIYSIVEGACVPKFGKLYNNIPPI